MTGIAEPAETRLARAVSTLARGAGDTEFGERLRARALAGGEDARVLAVLGRRGAGKSSLLNALCDQTVAAVGHVHDTTERAQGHRVAGLPSVVWVDAPGLRGAAGRDAGAMLEAWSPVATLVVLAAAEAATSDADLLRVASFLRRRPRGARGCVVAVTKVDELDPADIATPPFRHPKKSLHIAQACAFAKRGLARQGVHPVEVVPVCALQVVEEGAVVHDARWNLDALRRALSAMVSAVPDALASASYRRDARALLGAFVRVFEAQRRALSAEERDAVTAIVGVEVAAPGALSRAVLGDEAAWLRRAMRALG